MTRVYQYKPGDTVVHEERGPGRVVRAEADDVRGTSLLVEWLDETREWLNAADPDLTFGGREAGPPPTDGRTVLLTEAEMTKLTEANRLLTEITEPHSHACDCELCKARMLTDVQDSFAAASVPGVTLAEVDADADLGGEG